MQQRESALYSTAVKHPKMKINCLFGGSSTIGITHDDVCINPQRMIPSKPGYPSFLFLSLSLVSTPPPTSSSTHSPLSRYLCPSRPISFPSILCLCMSELPSQLLLIVTYAALHTTRVQSPKIYAYTQTLPRPCPILNVSILTSAARIIMRSVGACRRGEYKHVGRQLP